VGKVYCMSDIHGCLSDFEQRLDELSGCLGEKDAKLILMGDYIHGGPDSYGVLDQIMGLEEEYGSNKVIVLAGNHEDAVLDRRCAIESAGKDYRKCEGDSKYIAWMKKLRRYYCEGNTIFVHAGIEEEAEDLWELGTADYVFTEKYPAELGRFAAGQKIVAGHVPTSTIAGNPDFHDVYYDGESHYYIDGDTARSHIIPVLRVDTDVDEYCQLRGTDWEIIKPYE